MRTSDVVLTMGLLALALGLSPAVSFDGTRTPEGAPITTAPMPNPGQTLSGPMSVVPIAPPSTLAPATPRAALTPFEAFRSGTQLLRQGNTKQAVADLEFAARQGVVAAIWKLGRMYADGDGVDVNKARAFEYFRKLTGRLEDGTPAEARFVANAFMTLGEYYLDGVPETVAPNPRIAFGIFHHVAAIYADPVAQYQVGRLYLHGQGVPKDAMQAARWLQLSAQKGEYRAQALLGSMLFKGDGLQRQPATGLFWLIVAKDSAMGSDDEWITDAYAQAFAQASDSERAMAYKLLERWLKTPAVTNR